MDDAPSLKPERPLSGKQRRHLRGLAHHLKPVVQVGKGGLDDGLVAALRTAIRDHELVKVKVLETAPAGRDEVAPEIAQASGAHVVGAVGRTVILYRMHDEKPTIVLPR